MDWLNKNLPTTASLLAQHADASNNYTLAATTTPIPGTMTYSSSNLGL